MVYLERKRIADRDAAEAAGADLWTGELDQTVRGKLVAFWRLACAHNADAQRHVDSAVRDVMRYRLGLTDPPSAEDALLRGDVGIALSYVDAIAVVLPLLAERPPTYTFDFHYDSNTWRKSVSDIFESHRIKFKFVDGEIVPLGSEIMHAQVVEPTLVLLHGRPEFTNAEKAFRDALEEITNGKPDDAITDAGTALQEALTAVGCKGSTLGDLIKDAKNKGWFGPRDSPLADSIAKIHSWIAAERNAGEAHRVSDVTKDDAWFVVHVVGAAIVRLAAGPRSA